MSKATNKNKLAGEASPYLRQHMTNPVHWQPWGPEALDLAREQDKPILLSSGYATCYWCHVMEREVFENAAIAETMNRYFINVKLDREEYPDIDHLYMVARQLMTQEAGWPNNMFLTPEGKPFFGGGTFGATERYGKPGFGEILQFLEDGWRNRRDEIEQYATDLTNTMQQYIRREELVERQPITPSRIEQLTGELYSELTQFYDGRSGGFFQAPKFPHETYLLFLLAYFERSRDGNSLALLTYSLHRMAAGGLYDHVGGGFHRYCVDKDWLVPHFEKMLYTQALMALLYTRHHTLTQDPYTRDIARSVLEFVSGPMTSPQGMFYSAIDAETDNTEGQYYVWNGEELKGILDTAQLGFFMDMYTVADIPAHSGMNSPTGRVISAKKPLPAMAADRHMNYLEIAGLSGMLFNRLLAIRNTREAPIIDTKLIVGLNGLMIRAYAEGSTAFETPKYKEIAIKAVDFIVENCKLSDGSLTRYHDGKAGHLPAQLEDYAYLIYGLLGLAVTYDEDTTERQSYLNHATRYMEEAIDKLGDEETGAFYAAVPAKERIIRMKPLQDDALPSANATMLLNLHDFAQLTGDDKWEKQATRLEHTLLHRVEADETRAEYSMTLTAALLRHPDICQEVGPEKYQIPKDSNDILQLSSVVVQQTDTEATVKTKVEIKDSWYLHGPRSDQHGLLPMQVTVLGDEVADIIDVDYPDAVAKDMEYSDVTLALHEGTLEITSQLRLNRPLTKDSTLRAFLTCQPCSERACLEPMHLVAKVQLQP